MGRLDTVIGYHDPCTQGTLMYTVTWEPLILCVCVYYTFVFVPVVSVETRIMYYAHILYSSVFARQTVMQLPWKFQLVASVAYHLRIFETEFCVFAFPAIWWRFVELQRST
jgi:hypothetical protein